MFWALISSVLAAVGAMLIFVYYLRQGQFDDVEDVKYQMFREDEELDKRK
jgi:pentatricopeptide repeat protein